MYRLTEKGERIREMFCAIAPRYDLLNRLLSFGIDRRWRRFAVGQIAWQEGGRILDVATGTGDVALEIAAQTPASVNIVGVDFAPDMLELGKQKIAASVHRERITFQTAPCEELPFTDGQFDSVTIAFGIRNVVDRLVGLREICRVTKPGGRIVVLEFSTPLSQPFKTIYSLYFTKILPLVGGIFSTFSAYRYLPESVMEFPTRENFKALMLQAGFHAPRHHDLTGGIATVYVAEK